MMNSTFMPPAADVAGVYALIALVSDPKAAQDRLDELLRAKAEAEAVVARANMRVQAAVEAENQYRAVHSSAQSLMDKASAKTLEQDEREAELEALHEALTKRELGLAASTLDFDARSKARDEEMTGREEAAAKMLAKAERMMADAEKIKADYTAKVAAMRQIAG